MVRDRKKRKKKEKNKQEYTYTCVSMRTYIVMASRFAETIKHRTNRRIPLFDYFSLKDDALYRLSSFSSFPFFANEPIVGKFLFSPI